MNLTTTLKMAGGGVMLFALGAFATSVALGRFPVKLEPADQGRIEQVVHDYLIAHPEILAEMSNKLDMQQALAADKARSDALFAVGVAALTDSKVAYVAGPQDAKVTVAEFFDYRIYWHERRHHVHRVDEHNAVPG